MDVIESVTRVRSKVKLVCGTETIVIPASIYRERPLQPGDAVDLEEYDGWLLLRQYRPALDYAVSLLSQRDYAAGEIQQKLLRLGYRPQTVEMVLYKLTSNNLIDDAQFARQWAASRARRSLGKARIAQELRRKGVDKEHMEEALEALDEDDMLRCAEELARKGFARAKSGEDPRKTIQRVMAQLARRGYGYDVAKEAIRRALENAEE